MKKVLIAAAVTASLATPLAFAQTSAFTGFSVGANANTTTTSTELSGSGNHVKVGDSSQHVSLQAAYGLALGTNVVLGLGATYALGDIKMASGSGGGFNGTVKGKDAYSLYLEPGYAISNSTMVFGKLAYLSVKAEGVSGGLTSSKDFNGIGYGIGVRHKLNKNLFVQGEFLQSDYRRETVSGISAKPSSTTGSVGIGYQF